MQADALFTLDRVTLPLRRLRDVSLTVRRGITAVLGPSGAGKTSLLNILAGFERPASGKLVGDTRVAWAPQDDGLWPGCTAREHLTECGATVPAADALLASLDLAHRADAQPHKLSRGERSRLALARAMAMTPRTLVLDEPLAHVDTARAGRFWSVLREHIRRTGTSLIFATHSPEIALAEAAHAVCLRDGEVRFTGSIADIYERPASKEVAEFLGPSNWFTPEDARAWLGARWSVPRCIRPEHLSVCSDESGTALVLKSRFFGAYAETEVQTADQSARNFIHRPARPLAPGDSREHPDGRLIAEAVRVTFRNSPCARRSRLVRRLSTGRFPDRNEGGSHAGKKPHFYHSALHSEPPLLRRGREWMDGFHDDGIPMVKNSFIVQKLFTPRCEPGRRTPRKPQKRGAAKSSTRNTTVTIP